MRYQPRISILNRQRATRFSTPRLRKLALPAVPLCLAARGPEPSVLPTLAEITISIVSDARIARMHQEFCGVPGFTDVITFQHGEIIVSAQTAARAAASENEPLERELLRYVVHGLLHLNGHRDELLVQRRRMWRAQENVVAALWNAS